MSPFVALILSLALLNRIESTTGQLNRGGFYSAVRIQSSGYQCITDVPSMIATVDSFLQCAAQCNEQDGCYDFNIIDSETDGRIECQLYIARDSLQYGVRIGCRSYQREGKICPSDVSNSNLVPVRCCSFPFTLNGIISYQCAKNSVSDVTVGCFLPGRRWVTPMLPDDYTAQYSKTNMSMPGNAAVVIPVLSINSWITIQNKVINGPTTFHQNWFAYRNGFGNAALNDNYWIGNEFIYQLTSSMIYSLRVEVQRLSTSSLLVWQSAEYSTFNLDLESSNYVLHVKGYSGDAGDALMDAAAYNWIANGRPFKTWDNDINDVYNYCGCAGDGGWWFGCCVSSTLTTDSTAVWTTAGSALHDVMSSHMMITAIK